MTIFEAKRNAIAALENISPSAALDISIFLCHILHCDKTFLLLHNKDELTVEQEALLWEAVQKRTTGLPVAYITGEKEFFGNTFYVSPDVLIPKPDTEILVEAAINYVSSANDSCDTKFSICDMCTGSGCIGISVYLALTKKNIPVHKFPNFVLADISEKALQVAAKNFDCLIGKSCAGWKFVQSNLFEKIPESFNLILTNPPYIPAKLVNELLNDGRNEPRLALDGDINPDDGKATCSNDGLGIIRKLLPQIFLKLVPGGQFFMETGEYNAEETANLASEIGFTNISILKDLEGQLRVVSGMKPKN